MRPNFVVFIADDQGYGDLSCMGARDLATPRLDALAAGGARFTDWYSNCPVCSPSRASLLTGRYPGNAGVRSILAGHRTATGMPPHVPTLATALKKEGYRTYMSGKWHLGMQEESRPHNHGFDHWQGFLAGCIDYYSHIFYWGMNRPGPGKDPTHDLWEDGRECWNNGAYYTEMVTRKAVAYIRDACSRGEPFFLYVAYNAPHYPMHAPARYLDRFADLPPDRRIMAAMLSAMDDGVGEIMDELARRGLVEDTCVFFTSDNGPSRESRNWLDGTPDPYYGGTTGGLKGHKGSLYDGGIRVPGILHWPSRIPAGQVLDAPCASMDVFPTLMTAAGADVSAYERDGRDLLPYVCKGNVPEERDLYWEYSGQSAVRRGRWKLVLDGRLEEGAPAEDSVHLSDLREDAGEQKNCAGENPDVVADLTGAVKTWRDGIERRWKEEFSVEKQGTVTHPEGKKTG